MKRSMREHNKGMCALAAEWAELDAIQLAREADYFRLPDTEYVPYTCRMMKVRAYQNAAAMRMEDAQRLQEQAHS